MREFLRQIPLFADLSDEDLGELCRMADEVTLGEGVVLFQEGDSGDKAFVIQDGELEILKRNKNREVLLAVRGRGEVIGELSLLQGAPRMATVRARTPSTLIAIEKQQLNHLVHTSATAAETLFFTALRRWQNTEMLLRQSEKMAQLGTLTAGVAHELNNPAAAVQRGAEQLVDALNGMAEHYVTLVSLSLTAAQQAVLDGLTERTRHAAQRPSPLDALTRSDRELALETWLEDLGLEDCWELAPVLVNLDLSDDTLAKTAATFTPDQLTAVLRWLNANYETFNLLAELSQGAQRISEIVKALKSYTYLDRGPVQAVDIHEGLENTLLILRHKLKSGIQVQRDYDPEMPTIYGYGSELNQVWTNLIDNAADALQGVGTITLRTRHHEDEVIVEVEDNGPGITPEVQERMFEPFFTTKAPGVGTGLGLDIAYNIVVHKHRGAIDVSSQPGRTCFTVRLPINFEET